MRLAVAFTIVTLAPLAHADVSIVDNDKSVTVDCAKDKQVDLVGTGLTVTLTGTCALVNITGTKATVTGSATKFVVAGNRNVIHADATDEIFVGGIKNTVTWKRGATLAAPKITTPGKDNKVTQAK
jgi:hypothetical protein